MPLYSKAAIYMQGFEDVTLPDKYFELAISNILFEEIASTIVLQQKLTSFKQQRSPDFREDIVDIAESIE